MAEGQEAPKKIKLTVQTPKKEKQEVEIEENASIKTVSSDKKINLSCRFYPCFCSQAGSLIAVG